VHKELNKLKSLIKTSTGLPVVSAGGWLFGNNRGHDDNFYLYAENRTIAIEIYQLIDKIWRKDINISSSVSKNWFESELKYILREKFEHNQEFTHLDWKNFIQIFLNRDLIDHEIFKEIRGCKINGKLPLQIAHFTFYSWPLHFKHIKDKYPKAFEKQYPSFYDERISMTLISTIVKSRDGLRAHELADIEFKKIENTLRYIFTSSPTSTSIGKNHDIGIFDFRKGEWLESNDITENYKGGIHKPIGTYKDLSLNQTKLKRKKHILKIWDLLAKKQPTNIETRILNAIQWIGKAKHELEKEKAFIQYFFAIESLVNFNETGSISPSVGAQMREYTAFILEKKPLERQNIDKLFSKLYQIRSSIVHGNLKEITDYEIEDLQKITERLVLEFLSNPKFDSISSDGLKSLIYNMKYANT